MRLKLSTWILLAAVAGLAAGSFTHDALPDAAAASAAAGYYGILSDIFLRLIKMVIAPLVFATVVTGIAGTGDANQAYDLLSSTNLATWSKIGSVTNGPDGRFQITLPSQMTDSFRAFRLRLATL